MAKFKIDKEKLNAKSINRTIRIKPEVYDQLSEISKNTGVSFNKVINECIEYALSHMWLFVRFCKSSFELNRSYKNAIH